VVLTEGRPALAAGVQRLRASEFQQWVSAQDALTVAEATAQGIVARAGEVREQARQEGLAQGRAQARDDLVQAVADLRGQLRRWVLDTEPKLVELVWRCVQEVVRGVDPSQLVRGSIDRALGEMATAPDVRIQVHESEVAALRESLAQLAQRHDIRGVLRVEASVALKPGDCIVESPLGLVDLRIDSQLAFIDRTLHPQ
jgi:type III secretion protein L